MPEATKKENSPQKNFSLLQCKGRARFNKLKENLIFAMSLGSKELFHSNFIEFILEFCSENFPAVKECFGINGEITKVEREKKNFDLQITYEDAENKERTVVIENKFKSIPNIEQLIKYSESIGNNKTTKCILLAPKTSIECFKKKDGEKITKEWECVSYERYIKALKKYVKKTKKVDDEKVIIIKEYVEFVKILIEELACLKEKKFFPQGNKAPAFALIPRKESITNKKTKKQIINTLNQGSELIKSYEALRIDDLIKKLWAEHLWNAIVSKAGVKSPLKEATEYAKNKNPIDFSNKNAILTFRLCNKAAGMKPEEDHNYGVQIQDGKFRTFINLKKQLADQKKKDIENEKRPLRKLLRDPFKNLKVNKHRVEIEEMTPSKNSWSKYIRSFRDESKGTRFIYEQIDLSQEAITVEELRTLIEKILRKMKKILSKNKKSIKAFYKNKR